MRGGLNLKGLNTTHPRLAPPHGAGLKSRPILAPSPLWGGENLRGAKQGGADQTGRVKLRRAKLSSLLSVTSCWFISAFIFFSPSHLYFFFFFFVHLFWIFMLIYIYILMKRSFIYKFLIKK